MRMPDLREGRDRTARATPSQPAGPASADDPPTLRLDVRAPDPPVRAAAGGVPPVGPARPRRRARASPGSSPRRGPGTVVEHVGSSAVPGLPGKNVVDLGIEADPDDIPAITDALLSLGFGRQGGARAVPADPADAAPARRPRRRAVPDPPPRHAAGPRRAAPSWSRSATRCARTPRCATRTPRPKRRIVEAAPDGDGEPAVHGPQGRLRPGRAVPARDPHGPGGRAGAARRPARRSGSWAAASSAGCSALAARAMGYRIVALDPDPACPAAAVADEIDRRALRRRRRRPAARRAKADVVTYELEHVGPRGGRGRRRGRPAAARAGGAPGDPGPARRAAVHPRDRRVRRAVARGPRRRRRPRPPRTRSATRAGSSCRSAATTAGARPGSRARPRSRPRSRALGGDDGRPLLLERGDRLRGRAVGGLRPRPRRAGRCAFPAVAQRPRRRDPRRERRAGARSTRSSPLDAARDRRLARPRPRPRRAADRRAVPAARRRADDQRARAAGAQLRATGRSRARRRRSSSSTCARSSGCRWARCAPHGVGGDGQPAGHRRPTATRASAGLDRGARATRASTSTSTASGGCSSGARWAT